VCSGFTYKLFIVVFSENTKLHLQNQQCICVTGWLSGLLASVLYLQAVKEYVEEHRLRKDLLDTTDENGEEVEDDLAVADLDDDDDLEDDDGELSFEEISRQQEQEVSLAQPQLQPQPVSTTAVLPPHASPVSPSPPPQPVQQVVLPPQKSILKSQVSHEESVPSTPVSVASKKVSVIVTNFNHRC
jgi:hypothetical protein